MILRALHIWIYNTILLSWCFWGDIEWYKGVIFKIKFIHLKGLTILLYLPTEVPKYPKNARLS
jgi:hypothetical protein